jgi:hypothetical protein
VWIRQNTGRLIDMALWRELQTRFPARVGKRLAALAAAREHGGDELVSSSSDSDSDTETRPATPPAARNLMAPGELRRECAEVERNQRLAAYHKLGAHAGMKPSWRRWSRSAPPPRPPSWPPACR